MYVQFGASRYSKDLSKPEQVQWRGTKIVRVLEHMPCKENMRELSLFRLEKRRLWRSTSTSRDIIQETKPSSSQQYLV